MGNCRAKRPNSEEADKLLAYPMRRIYLKGKF